MGKGAYVSIQNAAGEAFDVEYANLVYMYQHGEEGSDFGPISGRLEANGSLPAGQPSQYIEAISNPYESSFEMDIACVGEMARLKFLENYHTWWTDTPVVKLRQGTIEIKTVVTQSGSQYAISISIKYSISPEKWMGSVESKISDTALCMLPIPGSHDAMSYPNIMRRSQTQSKDIQQQLEAGFRYFDFRVKLNDGVYYGYHGGDNTEHDYTSIDPYKGNRPFIFDQIKDFLTTHPKELLILNFSHFKGFEKSSQARDFITQLESHFAGLLVPRALTPSVTYGTCINNRQRVVAIISDDDDDNKLAQDWYQYPANTPPGKNERDHSLFWMSSDCCLQRYTAIRQSAVEPVIADIHANMIATLKDQEEYLEPSQTAKDHRDLSKFWVTQVVLNYDAVPYKDHSLNFWGARIGNPLAADIYEANWRHGHTHDWNGTGTKSLSPPNILLLDFAGEYDGFPEACIRMV